MCWGHEQYAHVGDNYEMKGRSQWYIHTQTDRKWWCGGFPQLAPVHLFCHYSTCSGEFLSSPFLTCCERGSSERALSLLPVQPPIPVHGSAWIGPLGMTDDCKCFLDHCLIVSLCRACVMDSLLWAGPWGGLGGHADGQGSARKEYISQVSGSNEEKGISVL